MKEFDKQGETAWCAGCGNFGILAMVKKAMEELQMPPEKVVLVSGIGQAAKLPQYVRSNFFNGLHGRAFPAATAIKSVNPELNVIITSGDGDMYGEGGNHFIHNIRRNPDVKVIVHNNMVYGLTKGQASPTSQKGMKTPVQTTGVVLEPFNPVAVAISLDASFVARASIHDPIQTKEIIKKALQHKGFALVDIFQPCPTFNKINTYDWFKAKSYYLDANYNPKDKVAAFAKAIETEKFALGVLYFNPKKTFEELVGVYENDKTPVIRRPFNKDALAKLLNKSPGQSQTNPTPQQQPSSGSNSLAAWFSTTVKEIWDEAREVKTFVVEKPQGYSYKAGQYLMMSFSDKRVIDGKDRIPLTIASSPTEQNIRLTVKKQGHYTTALFGLKPGERVIISKPTGEVFTFDESHNEKIVMLSAGSGITPFISILRFIRAKNMRNKVVMLNGNCTYDDIIFRPELDNLSRDNLFIMNTLDKFDGSWGGEKGFISKEMVLKYVKNPKEFVFMICGPVVMTRSLEKALLDVGVPASSIKIEKWEIPAACERK